MIHWSINLMEDKNVNLLSFVIQQCWDLKLTPYKIRKYSVNTFIIHHGQALSLDKTSNPTYKIFDSLYKKRCQAPLVDNCPRTVPDTKTDTKTLNLFFLCVFAHVEGYCYDDD